MWRLAGLQVPRKRPRRRVSTHRPRPQPATAARHVWAYDFVLDAFANGQQLKCLTVIDEYTRECLAIDVAGSIRSARVIEVLSQLISLHGAPRYLRSDNGPEFVSHAIRCGKGERRARAASDLKRELSECARRGRIADSERRRSAGRDWQIEEYLGRVLRNRCEIERNVRAAREIDDGGARGTERAIGGHCGAGTRDDPAQRRRGGGGQRISRRQTRDQYVVFAIDPRQA